MANVFLGGSLDEIREVMREGLQPKHMIRCTLLEAMIDARNSVGLNRRFKPVVLVIELPQNLKMHTQDNQPFYSLKNFRSHIKRIYSVKIDFKAPNLVSVSGTISPYAILPAGNQKLSFHKEALR
ncbi:hypothetical protein [Desulfotomaculum sp. 1211_IL3151]|uniref:hypothetical protein n=1 Tax=Desulfotomaculum sp. 1211_IL3151 TaxID=3084055 RepID=UPI002FD9F20A